TIRQASPDVAGDIKCIAKNKHGSVDCSAKFNVRRKPRFDQELKAKISAPIDSSCTLTVKASGWPRPKLSWYKNGESLSTSATIQIKEDQDGDESITGLLKIENLTVD